ncbi:MAG: hypothetical protein XD72_0886 [Methanothrix harundinacea]|uniref:Uncharacterized protein n=1 Tax=Methanothrix harundinacea TaxID=301375 RepID=A0A101IJE3_9EURY|nr:MAG: hypothetical protein XD72_0886 [Methanothrix harundinacea]KUK95955.1 MAG: hypothetical protein XE07_1482 [Methanothrix harundinacea]
MKSSPFWLRVLGSASRRRAFSVIRRDERLIGILLELPLVLLPPYGSSNDDQNNSRELYQGLDAQLVRIAVDGGQKEQNAPSEERIPQLAGTYISANRRSPLQVHLYLIRYFSVEKCTLQTASILSMAPRALFAISSGTTTRGSRVTREDRTFSRLVFFMSTQIASSLKG